MSDDSYVQGFLLTTALLTLEHLTLYARLKRHGDAGVIVKFGVGVLAILAGCAWIAWQQYDARALLAPAASSAGGLVVAAGYVGRWLWGRALGGAYTRGWLNGLADKGDLADDPARERNDRHD
jgi:hypothetical protein